ncbi:MAG: flavoprotein [Epulopiscium sp. Nuni2H_MBin001]|nr:MAG: flavoprotein [Epulopiscium sp. Nuni2H_MBin001]
MITQNFFWVGEQDPSLRVFDIIMNTEFGTSYNSYLLKGQNNEFILFETVKNAFGDEYINKLKDIVGDLSNITHVVVNHTEPDHAGSLVKLITMLDDITIIASAAAIKFLGGITNLQFKSIKASEQKPLNLAGYTLHFKSVPFLHWPDTIYTYIEEEKILVTCDSFGAHYSSDRILFSEHTEQEVKDFNTAYEYYFNMIMGPFKSYVLNALEKIKDLDIDYVCPGHGLVFDKSNFEYYKNLYRTWSTPTFTKEGVTIVYVSAYGYTKCLANKIAEGIMQQGINVELFDMGTSKFEDVIASIGKCKGLLVGSPTILGDALPPIWQLLISLNPVIHKGIIAGCFGSSGWSGEATINIAQRLSQLNFKQPLEPFNVYFKPSETDEENAVQFGIDFANGLNS